MTFNYRLGAFGFLATTDKASSGNMGILDQIMVLKWVQKNIESFGGDANKVTIFGEDAGAASVSILALSPEANGKGTFINSQLSRCCIARGLSTGWFQACSPKVKACKSILFTEGSPVLFILSTPLSFSLLLPNHTFPKIICSTLFILSSVILYICNILSF